jgi:hypothetical protein
VTAGRADLVVAGSGSLARSVCHSLAAARPAPAAVVVVARSGAKAAEVCEVAGTRAALSGSPARFRPVECDLADGDRLAAVLGEARPRAVLGCASVQSPWERTAAPSAWTELLAAAGFGLALPLHGLLALRLAAAVEAAAPGATYVNACYPDAVNPLLRAAGHRVAFGIGNVAILAATLQAALGLPDQRRLQVLAHHWHLHAPDDPAEEALAWCDGRPVEDVGRLVAGQRAVGGAELNLVTGHAAALLLRDLLAGAEVATSLPGPGGLPGGYPVVASLDGARVQAPPGMTVDEAVARNRRWAERDGVVVEDDGRVVVSAAAAAAIRPHLPALAGGFSAADAVDVAGDLLALRDWLRAEPAGQP